MFASLIALKGALSGWKTYIGLAAFALCVISENVLGVDVQGFTSSDDWLRQLIYAFLGATTRSAVKNVGANEAFLRGIVAQMNKG